MKIFPTQAARMTGAFAILLMAGSVAATGPAASAPQAAAAVYTPATARPAAAPSSATSASRTPPSAPSPAPPWAKDRRVAGFYQIAHGGIDDTHNAYSWSMAWFNGRLYVGTSRNNLCGSNIARTSAWAKRVTGCPDGVGLLQLDSRAEIWAYTPSTGAWQLVYRSPMRNFMINGFLLRIPRDLGYRSMAVYTDRHGVTALYVGTTSMGGIPAHLLRSTDGVHFTTLDPAGLGVYADSIRALTPYDGRLFVAPMGVSQTYSNGANHDKILMSDDPTSGRWVAVSRSGFGDFLNSQIYSMAAFDGQLYAAASNPLGYQLWRTNAQGAPPYTWTPVLINGAYRGPDSPSVTDMAVFHNKLYVGSAAETLGAGGSLAKPCELVAVNPDDSWDLIVGDARQTPEGYKWPLSGLGAGFGNRFNVYLWKMATHDGWLYAGTYDYSVFGLPKHPIAASRVAGFDLWKSHDGVHWVKVAVTGFGNPYNYGVRTMQDTPAGLFLGTANPFANAPKHRGGTEIWLMPSPDGLVRPHGVAISPSACPMAHCSPHIDGNESIAVPRSGVSAAWQFRSPGTAFSYGLGCSAGTHLIVCASTNLLKGESLYSTTYVHAFDTQGHELWNSRNLLDASVAAGVPLLDDQDNSYVSDISSIISFTPEGVVRWRTPNPAHAALVSLNILPSGYLIGQAGLGPTGRSLLVVINPQTGAIASSLDLTDSINGVAGEWATQNTVSVVGNRVYTVTQFQPFSHNASDPLHHGRLYAIDVDANGQPHVAWYWSFEGPSGGSPLTIPGAHPTIYFDGAGITPGAPAHVMLFALQDMGSTPTLLWANDLTQSFGVPYPTSALAAGIQAAPAHDPRGGVWVWSEFDSRVFRFDERTGRALDTLRIPALTGDPGASPNATIDIATNGGIPVMFIGVMGSPGHANGVAAIDLTTDQLLWTAPVGTGVISVVFGQFPLIPIADGGTLLVVPTADGVVHGFRLT